ncbi:MAG: hypothetical protein ACFCU6_02195 [Balneolaceae bacterium]
MKLKTRSTIGIFIVICIIMPGCDTLDEASNRSIDDLEFKLNIDPDQISRDGEFTATYSIHNNSSQTVEMVSGCTQLARGIVFRDGEVVNLKGSADGCFTAISTHVIDAGNKFERVWKVKPFSVRFFPDDREPDTTFAEPGEYTFTVKSDVIEVNGEGKRLPDLERIFFIE